ncbi:MAG: hypothetical protein GC136_05010 [Alphaproteobacteria bacterium]|nr:hypothetical protein [Alphaproteobacteria bacterium]
MTTDIGLKGNLIILALAATAFVGLKSCQQEEFTAQDGAEYLVEQGRTNIQGGEVDVWNWCIKGEIGRRYTVDADQSGEREEVVVCNGWGTHIAPF